MSAPTDTITIPRADYDLLKEVAEDAAQRADIAGALCPDCGRNNSNKLEGNCLCSADDCPGVMAIKAHNLTHQ